jgi:hypothetical protein
MRQVIYMMHFRGQASRSSENANALRATSSGTSSTMSTVVRPNGVATTLQPAAGDLAFLEADLTLSPPDAFAGSGTLSFGDDGEHALHFSTFGAGHLGPCAKPGVMAGAANWRIDGGKGEFATATGFVSSTFMLSDDGDLNEYHCGMIFLAD